MNREVRILQMQSLFDISIEKCGSIEAVFRIAELNGLSITDTIEAGTAVVLPEVIDGPVAEFYRKRGLKPATDYLTEASEGGGGSGDMFDDGIDYMAVGVDNVVT